MADAYPLRTYAADGRFHWRYPIDLDRPGTTTHILEFHFAPLDNLADGTDGAWYLDIYDAAGTPALLGLKLSLGRDKLGRYQYRPNVPQGQLDVIDSTGAGREPTSTDLGTRVIVLYTPPP